MKKSHRTTIVLGLFLLISSSLQAEADLGPSQVYFKGKQLLVAKPGSQATPFIIKGVTWSPETVAPDYGPNPLDFNQTVEYGFFFDWPNRHPQGHEIFVYWKENQFIKHYQKDIPLMKEMNLNVVRVYSCFSEDCEESLKILDHFFKNGIMVIMNVAMSKKDIDSQRYKKIVKAYKDHPAILFAV